MAKKKGQNNEDISFELLDEDAKIIEEKQPDKEITTSKKDEKIKDTDKVKATKPEEEKKTKAEIVKELEEYKNLLQLSRAEFDNYRKRSYSLLQSAKTDGELNVILKFLPTLDAFEKAKEMISDTNVLKGVEMIEKSLKEALKSIGVEEMQPIGKIFDANLHNALSVMNDSSKEEDEIVQVYKEGYTYNGKVIRYAQVIINKK